MKNNEFFNYHEKLKALELNLRSRYQNYDILSPDQKLSLSVQLSSYPWDESCEKYLEALLICGACVTYVNEHGKTLLDIAIDSGNSEAALWLAEKGATVNESAKGFFTQQVTRYLKELQQDPVESNNEFFKKLIKYGADVGTTEILNIVFEKNMFKTFSNIFSYITLLKSVDFIDSKKAKTLTNVKALSIVAEVDPEDLASYGGIICNLKLETLCHNEIETNLHNCTIHKFVLFNYFRTITGFFSKAEIIKIDTAINNNFFKLLTVCKHAILTKDQGVWCDGSQEMVLPSSAIALIAQNFDFSDWLSVTGVSDWFINPSEI